MLDIFIGKSPARTPHPAEPAPVQQTVREVIRTGENSRPDRRKNTSDRRRRAMSEDYLVTLSGRRDRRIRPDRRQSRAAQPTLPRQGDRRKNRLDRRRSVNSGVRVTLSTRKERRSRFDRRGNRPL